MIPEDEVIYAKSLPHYTEQIWPKISLSIALLRIGMKKEIKPRKQVVDD